MLHNKLGRDTAGHSAGTFTCQHDFSERVVGRNYPWSGLGKRKRKGRIYLPGFLLYPVDGVLSHGNDLLSSQAAPSRPSVDTQDVVSRALQCVFHPNPKVMWIRHELRERKRTDRHGGDCT